MILTTNTTISIQCSQKASVGYIGPNQKVTRTCHERENSIGELALELGYEEYFENPEAVGVIYADCSDNVRQIEGVSSMYLEENKTWHINNQHGEYSRVDYTDCPVIGNSDSVLVETLG